MKLHSCSQVLFTVLAITICLAAQVHARGHANLFRLHQQHEQELQHQLSIEKLLQERQQQNRLEEIHSGQSHQHESTSFAQRETMSRQQLVDSLTSNVTTEWFPQVLDHFQYSASPTIWKQRFHYNFQYFQTGGPVFLFIGGEAPQTNTSIARGFVMDIARQFGGALFSLEHRYYGQSQPFATLDTQNLIYLTVEQALEDAAQFMLAMNARFKLNAHGENPWVTIGGSYPGALSAYMRIKYPSLVAGSWASSAPVEASLSFWQFDTVVAAGAGPQCSDAIRSATRLIETALDASPASAASMKAKFGCQGLVPAENTDFLYVIADAVTYAIQYSTTNPRSRNYNLRDFLCNQWMLNATAASQPGQDLTDNLAGFLNGLMDKLGETCTTFTTTLPLLANTTVTEEGNMRQWYWQSCIQFGFFQVAPNASLPGQPIPLRSPRIDLAFHLDLCQKAFSGWQLIPTIEAMNARYGGQHLDSSRIYFSNGGYDPWQVLSVEQTPSCCPEIRTHVINGTSHCAEFAIPNPDTDVPDLTRTRLDIIATIGDWISDYGVVDCSLTNRVRCGSDCVDTRYDVFHCGSCSPAVIVDSSNSSEFICQNGTLYPSSYLNPSTVPGTIQKAADDHQLLWVGLVFFLSGFTALGLGLHALRKISIVEALERNEQRLKLKEQVDVPLSSSRSRQSAMSASNENRIPLNSDGW